MITRGYLIGFIIDELADIVSKVLNLVYSLELKNFNTEKANYSGIDIDDKEKK